MFQYKLKFVGITYGLYSAIGFGIIEGICKNQGLHSKVKELGDKVNSCFASMKSAETAEFCDFYVALVKNRTNWKSFSGNENKVKYCEGIGYSIYLLANYLANVNKELNISTYEQICRALGLSMMIIEKGEKVYYGCKKGSILISIHHESPDCFSLLLCEPENDKKILPYIYTMQGNVSHMTQLFYSNAKSKLDEKSKAAVLASLDLLNNTEFYHYILPKSLILFHQINKKLNCPHIKLKTFISTCGNHHCVLCIVEYIKNFNPFEWMCECQKRISPKDFKRVCEKFRKIKQRKLEMKQRIISEINQKALIKVEDKFQDRSEEIKSESARYVNESKEKCTECKIGNAFTINCKSHAKYCNKCRSSNLNACDICKRQYSSEEKRVLSEAIKSNPVSIFSSDASSCIFCKRPLDSNTKSPDFSICKTCFNNTQNPCKHCNYSFKNECIEQLCKKCFYPLHSNCIYNWRASLLCKQCH